MPGEGTGEEFDLCLGGDIAVRQINGDDIKSHRRILPRCFREPFAKDAGHRSQHLLLLLVDRKFGWHDIAVRAGLHLDEAERVAVPGDEIHIAWDLRRFPPSRYDDIPMTSKVEEGFFLTAKTSSEVRRDGGSSSESG